jgi:hypothetical protein
MRQHDQVVRQPEVQDHLTDPGSLLSDSAARRPPWRRRGWGVVALVLTVALGGWLVTQTQLRGTVVELNDQFPSASGAQKGAPAVVGWQPLPRAPLSPRWGSFAAWTGTEFVVWGGYANVGTPQEATADDGAAFNPDTGRWRQLARAPVEGMYGGSAVWTGREFWVLGGIGEPYGRTSKRSAAAYEPTTDTWRRLPDLPAPISTAAWSRQSGQVVVAGVHADTGAMEAWALDVDGDHWVALPPLPELRVDPVTDPGVSVTAGAGRAFVVAGDAVVAVDLDQPNHWTTVADVPTLAGAATGRLAAWTNAGLLVTTPEDAALYDPVEQTWHQAQPPPPLEGAQYALHATAGGYPLAVDEPTANLAVFASRRQGWVTLPDAPTPAGTNAAVVAGTHRGRLIVFIWGGSDRTNVPLRNGAVLQAPR